MTLSTKIQAPEGHSIHHVPCPHDCPDTCSMLVTRDDETGKAVRVQGDPTSGSEAVRPYSYSGTLGMLGYRGMDQRFWNKMNAARYR